MRKIEVYQITNLINQKRYIGITNNYKRRWQEHCKKQANSLIHKAIVKYGEENFKFEILYNNVSEKEAEKLEKELIKEYDTLAPKGYNLAKGGKHRGTKQKISDDEIAYIKNHRNIPMYVLYISFQDKISYEYFKMIYNNKIRTDIPPTVDCYPYNSEFSLQFNANSSLSYQEVVDLRKRYDKGEYWKDIYFAEYQNRMTSRTFWDIYTGKQYKLVMPEVFSKENKYKRSSLANSGENNSNHKLSLLDVKKIRELKEKYHKTNKEIALLYPNITLYTIQDIVSYRTWKNVE